MDLPFGLSAYSRRRGNLVELPVVNMFAEKAMSEGRVVLQSRPGLSVDETIGSGPINGIFQRDGILSGSRCVVSGSSLYVAGVNKGTVAGGGYVSFAGDELELTISAGGAVYKTDGASLAAMDFAYDAIKMLDLAGYNIAIRGETGRFYWRLWGVNTWDELDYATAENEPDQLLDGLAIDDYLVLFGTETVEFWPKTGDSELPFAPTQGRVFEKGIRATGCATSFDNTAAWVTSVKQGSLVCRAGNVPMVISNPGVEELIADSATCRLDSFFFEGHEFLMLRLDTTTRIYDAQSQEWAELASWGRDNFCGQTLIAGPYFGDDTDGKIWAFNSAHTDNGGVLERRFRAGASLDAPTVIDSLKLTVNSGQAPNLSGNYTDPVIEMRTSDDAGQTWSDWEPTELGVQGAYRQRVEWRRLGMFDDPGIVVEFRCTDPVPLRVSRVTVNGKSGGRGRG